MNQAKTLWEEGRESASEIITLGVALVLSIVTLDIVMTGRVSLFFDLCFVALCVGLAIAVRPADFFTVGVLPPLLMLGAFVLLAATGSSGLTRADDSATQSVISALSHHSIALVSGYGLALGVLFVRQRIVRLRTEEADRSRLTAARGEDPDVTRSDPGRLRHA